MFDKLSLTCRSAALATTALTALMAGCAMPILPPDSIDAVRAPHGEVTAVDIEITQDTQRRLVVRYRAPDTVPRLDFLIADDRVDTVFRTPSMKPADDCGALVRGGLALRHGAGCERGAAFVVEPRAMQLDAMYEPAQPSTDGGVLFHTSYYAAAAPGLPIRWRFTPLPGDYGIDDSRRHDAAWQVAAGSVYRGAKAQGDQRNDDDWLTAQHAQHYVFLGHSPIWQTGDMLWVRDPAVAQTIVDTVSRAGAVAWDAYARAAARKPEGHAAIVMLSMPPGNFGYHGDRTEGRMLRLAFASADTHDEMSASAFVAHETAHLWNHGLFGSDMKRPWLHEGDADWASLNAMHDAGLLPDQALVDQMQAHMDGCLSARGERPAATLKAGRSHEDDPYACGFALQLLGFARVHAAHPEATPLATWGALHRAHPMLDAAGFAQFFDQGGPAMLGPLLLDDKAPFGSTYRADLATYLPLHEPIGEPGAGAARRQLAWDLMDAIGRADCSRAGFTLRTNGDQGGFTIDADLDCKSLPAGASLTTLAGVAMAARPHAAWQAVQRACATRGTFEAGFDGHAPVTVPCPKPMPGPPPRVALPDDVLTRLGLTKKTS
jgi:hypothetical protein